jgi:hypothetical protein
MKTCILDRGCTDIKWNSPFSARHSLRKIRIALGPFHLIYTPPRKKDQSADTNTPLEIKAFLPYPSEKTQRSKDADAHNPSETAFQTGCVY